MTILSSSPALAAKLAAMKAARLAASEQAPSEPAPELPASEGPVLNSPSQAPSILEPELPPVSLSEESKQELTQLELIQSKLGALEESLVAGTPGIATLLRDIHSSLSKDPEVVTLLSEEECASLVKGLKKQTGVEIATKLVKAKKPSKAALSKLTVDDL